MMQTADSNVGRETDGRRQMIRHILDQLLRGGVGTPAGQEKYEAAMERLGGTSARSGDDMAGSGMSNRSTYVRLGVVSLNEEREAAVRQVTGQGAVQDPKQERERRAYYQKLYRKLGIGLWEDAGPYKTGFGPHEYAHTMPGDILAGRTGTCLDPYFRQLYRTGYLPNRAQLWLAAYIIHWRRVRWQTGACWYLMHRHDGEPAGDNLSWQWVAGTFGDKPYYFTLDDLQRQGVAVDVGDNGEFVGSRHEIARRLFPQLAEVEGV